MTDEVAYNPLITNKTLQAINDCKSLLATPKFKTISNLELGKEICISLNPRQGTIEELYSLLTILTTLQLLLILLQKV